jgi:hypothetical protein
MTAYFSFEQSDPKGNILEFIFALKDETRIAESRAIIADSLLPKRHVMGAVIPSRAVYNPSWSFHLAPNSISFFENAIEVCDANVTYIESHLDEVGGAFLPKSHWCPWNSWLKREIALS